MIVWNRQLQASERKRGVSYNNSISSAHRSRSLKTEKNLSAYKEKAKLVNNQKFMFRLLLIR
jgi:hypothetical protein